MSAVAQTILEQLGGGRFAVMTGAKNFMASGSNSLQFSLPAIFASRGINRVQITLEANDTYTVRFWKVRGVKLALIEERELVYCDDLQRVFTDVTGLYTNLGSMRASA